MVPRNFASAVSVILACTLGAQSALAQKRYGPGVTDTEIKIGQTMAYSGPASALGALGRGASAFFEMVNENGGVNGRKIKLLSLDDGFSPPKTVEQTRKLVEQEQVLFMYNSLGSATNSAVMKYLNDRQVPQLFLGAGAAKFTDPRNFPWTVGFQPNFVIEGRIYAQYLLKERPNARIGVLYQADDLGKDLVRGLKAGLGDKAKTMIVAEQSYELTDPTVDSQVIHLNGSGADVFFHASTPKFAAQALRKAWEIGWKPLHVLNTSNQSINAVLAVAGVEKAVGATAASMIKDAGDPQWQNDPGFLEWLAWMKKYYPTGSLNETLNVAAYIYGQAILQVLKQCGDDLTRANVMRQALNLDIQPAMTLPGIRVKTSPTKYAPIDTMQLMQFDGRRWVLIGEPITAATD